MGRTDGRCPCGCRAFTTQTLVVTTSEGDIWGTKDFLVGNCIRCSRRVSIKGGNGEAKVVEDLPAGMAGEKTVLLEAFEACVNKDHKEQPNFLLRTQEDKKDLARLGITEYK